MQLLLRKCLFVLGLALLASGAWAEGERGWFGFTPTIEGEGMFWNPTLVSVTIEAVAPGSPSAAQGLAKGDLILEVDGKPIVGRKAKEIQAVVQSKAPGDKLVLRLKRPNGDIYVATLIAATRPAS